mgnify:CR=1 FL=1
MNPPVFWNFFLDLEKFCKRLVKYEVGGLACIFLRVGTRHSGSVNKPADTKVSSCHV